MPSSDEGGCGALPFSLKEDDAAAEGSVPPFVDESVEVRLRSDLGEVYIMGRGVTFTKRNNRDGGKGSKREGVNDRKK